MLFSGFEMCCSSGLVCTSTISASSYCFISAIFGGGISITYSASTIKEESKIFFFWGGFSFFYFLPLFLVDGFYWINFDYKSISKESYSI